MIAATHALGTALRETQARLATLGGLLKLLDRLAKDELSEQEFKRLVREVMAQDQPEDLS